MWEGLFQPPPELFTPFLQLPMWVCNGRSKLILSRFRALTARRELSVNTGFLGSLSLHTLTRGRDWQNHLLLLLPVDPLQGLLLVMPGAHVFLGQLH